MDVTPLGSVSKTALATLPKLIKKVFYFESFFRYQMRKKQRVSLFLLIVSKREVLSKNTDKSSCSLR